MSVARSTRACAVCAVCCVSCAVVLLLLLAPTLFSFFLLPSLRTFLPHLPLSPPLSPTIQLAQCLNATTQSKSKKGAAPQREMSQEALLAEATKKVKEAAFTMKRSLVRCSPCHVPFSF